MKKRTYLASDTAKREICAALKGADGTKAADQDHCN